MGIQLASYQDVRSKMKPGDVIAFGGKGNFSEIIKLATLSKVSHVGVVLQTSVISNKTKSRYFNQIIESTSLNDFDGVIISRLSERINSYSGDIWWLPLRNEIRTAFNEEKFYTFMFSQKGKKYDMLQAIKSGVDFLDKLPFGIDGPTLNTEDFGKFFCSELVSAGLEESGAIPAINSSEVTPIDLCRFSIYKDDYYLLKPDVDNKKQKAISRYNSMNPNLWKE